MTLCSAALLAAVASSRADDLQLNDANPLLMPAVGSHGLRVLSPTLLELTLITAKEPDPARVSAWDFVSSDFQLSAPGVGQFQVTAAGQSVSVTQVGFKRRPLYAPLKGRDLRIASSLYLRLATPIADGQTVQVTNPDGQLWASSMSFTATADPLRWSPALHVNQVGYAPSFPKKAMVGYYLGSLGEMSIPTQQGFSVVNAAGQTVFQGTLTARPDSGFTYTPTPYQQVWQADFSALTMPGEYRLLVPGLGTSFPFLIHEGLPAALARTFELGIFHQRCGFKEEIPFTRHVHDACHTAPAQIPDMTFTAVNAELANMTSDSANYQSAPPLKDVNSSLYPFVDLSDRDVSGGHHDAGDYSKYTIDSAGFIHFLVFAADSFPGAGALDNLGIPESGDGKSDILQEAKWEADFLAKMQDSDGGFYFLVYPRDREYEDDVLPDKGDPQVVFPKTTSVTAAAVAALAEAGSSPLFKQQFPAEAALYLEKAKLGWSFLQNAIAQYGKAGAYQKITHYGNEFTHDDELAWAACALFVATGDQSYHQQLKAWYDPSDPNTRRWSWWRLFEGYGCAARTYAFAARSGRLPASALDPNYLAKCEAEIKAAADDSLRFAQESAYGTSFPDPNKAYRTAGWYFSSERGFDITVAYQLDPRPEYLDAIVSNANYEDGCNPVNVTYVTGLGSRRQREIVSQYAENDRRVLPPSGIPLGNVQVGFQYLDNYKGDLENTSFPADGALTAPYPYYDRWGDSFNTTTEFVIMDQARSLASWAFWMAQSSLQSQVWSAAAGQITGLPAQAPAKQNVTANLVVPGLDLSQARVVWEAEDQEPQFGNPVTFAAKYSGQQWVEVEAQLPDGRRVFATTNFVATTALDTPPNIYQPAPLTLTPDMVALYHLDGTPSDSTGLQNPLGLAGQAAFDTSNLGWMANRQGAALHFNDLGDKATVSIPVSDLTSSDTTAIILEAMVYVDDFVAYNRDQAPIVSLYNGWDSFLEFGEDKYAGPYVRGGTQLEILGTALTSVLTPKEWHHLAIEINQGGYVFRLDGSVVASASSNELRNWQSGSMATLQLGNFSGWIDEVVVRNVRTGSPPNDPPWVALVGPTDGSTFAAPVNIGLSADAADSDGSVVKVEFFQGSTKLGEVGSGAYPFNFTWNGVPAGTYSITARATDDKGATSTSAPIQITVNVPDQAAVAPQISPNGGSFSDSTTVTIANETPGATVRYTTDGNDPTGSSPVYTGAFALSSSATVKAKAFKSGLLDSPVSSAGFVVTATGSAQTRVTFVRADSTTAGNWKGVYGGDGAVVLGDTDNHPAYAQIGTIGSAAYSWSGSSNDPRALQKVQGAGRVAGCWYSSTSYLISLGLTDGKTHRVALYCLDWDRLSRAQTVEILDAASNSVLNTQTLSGFAQGQYLVWDLQGQVKIRVSRLSGPNAVVMGLFFDSPNASSNAPAAPLLSWQPNHATVSTLPLVLHLTGAAGQEYVIEASTDLANWTPVSTNTLTQSDLDLTDVAGGLGAGKQFYRARAINTGTQYLIEASTDLVNWTAIGVSSSATDLSAFRQSDSGSFGNRFYRATLISPTQ